MFQKRFHLLTLAAFLGLVLAAPYLQAQHQEEFSKVLPLSSKGTFSLKNVNGSVTVVTWKEEKVEIRALKKTNKDAENLAKVKIEVQTAADSVSVETIYPKHNNTGVSVTYDVKVPEGVSLDEVTSVNGGVNITGPFGRVSASTVNGEVHVENASGDLHFSTTNGDVEALNLKGKIEAETTNGSIKLEINSLEGEIRAETTNGSINLRLSAPQEINADLEVETVNGTIDVEFPITLQGLVKTKHHLKGQIGKGGAAISLETVNGSIHLTK